MVTESAARVQRATAAGDVEATIGSSKEMVETVGKVVVTALGDTYGSDIGVPKLARQTLEVLGQGASGTQGRSSLGRLGGGLVSIVVGVAELRNTDGTGHGHGTPTDLDPSHADLAREAATTWCKWALSMAARTLRERRSLDAALNDFAGAKVYYRDDLPRDLRALRLETMDERYQRRFGLAVGRRWNVGDTFLAYEDVIQPMASRTASTSAYGGYPPAFAEGVVEGLLFDEEGYLMTSSRSVDALLAIAEQLPPQRKDEVFLVLADRAEDADLAYRFDNDSLDYAIDHLVDYARANDGRSGEPVNLIADRMNFLRTVRQHYADEDDE